jgi:hypothetical protein
MLEVLIPGIEDQTLCSQHRFNIQTDLYALARSNYINFVDYLKFLRDAYKNEDNFIVWKYILKSY